MIEVLCGFIASGKSSYCKQRAKDGWIVMNDDAIVNLVHSDIYTLYSDGLKPLYKSIEDHILHTAVAMGKDVVIDRGLDINSKSRSRWIAIGRSLDVPVRAIVFEAFPPEVHAARRAQSDSRGHSFEYWLKVARKHAERYECPRLEEGFVEIEERKWV
jgi:predicted kinase